MEVTYISAENFLIRLWNKTDRPIEGKMFRIAMKMRLQNTFHRTRFLLSLLQKYLGNRLSDNAGDRFQ